ncbi:hypothetical protein CEXT_168611 [Caerostris extrusa]|uniref:Uncharacterized protein n=1 Tax=Caerostris extrusa TaxID=172846 RepID=A0AAV4UAG4_CAEEX|nr:hypothetical protein CEXT_168611 [Caerostris extrusa]
MVTGANILNNILILAGIKSTTTSILVCDSYATLVSTGLNILVAHLVNLPFVLTTQTRYYPTNLLFMNVSGFISPGRTETRLNMLWHQMVTPTRHYIVDSLHSADYVSCTE